MVRPGIPLVRNPFLSGPPGPTLDHMDQTFSLFSVEEESIGGRGRMVVSPASEESSPGARINSSMGMRRASRALATALSTVMVLGLFVPGTGASGTRTGERRSAAADLGLRLRMLDRLQELRAPDAVLQALTTDDARVRRGRSVYAYPMRDITGDGVAEIVESDVRYSITIDQSESINSIVEEEYRTIIRVRDSRTGRQHWKKRYEDFVVIAPATIGRPGHKGVIAIAGLLSHFGGTTGDRYLTFTGLRGATGKGEWTKTYTSATVSHDFTTQVTVEAPVSFAFVQARKDAATEVLLGLATTTETALAPLTTATRTVLLSAADGSDVIHPQVDIGIDWLPFPDAIPDADGDGLDDYVVINDKGLSPGSGQEPPAIGGIVQARRGLDGTALWTEGGLEFRWFAWTIPLSNVVGDRRRDFGILTYNRGKGETVIPSIPYLPAFILERDHEVVMLTDAGRGNVMWTRRGTWIHSPGDLDGRGLDDVVVERLHFNFRKNSIRYGRLAYPGIGKRLWRYELVWRGEPCLLDACTGGGGAGIGSAGDVHPDSVSDRFVAMSLEDATGRKDRTYVLDGRSDRTMIRSGDGMFPLSVALDGKGDDVMNTSTDKGVVHLRARNGTTGETLWSMSHNLPRDILPRRLGGYGEGFHLGGDTCGDVLTTVFTSSGTFYAVVDGSTARVVWSEWKGAKGQSPMLHSARDLNEAC